LFETLVHLKTPTRTKDSKEDKSLTWRGDVSYSQELWELHAVL